MATLLLGGWPLLHHAAAIQIQNRSLQLSDNRPGATATYNISLSTLSTATIGSVKIEFCSNTALFTEACDPPLGLDDTAASLDSQSGITGFIIDPASTVNTIVLSRAASISGPSTVNFVLSNIKNASYRGSFFARYSTYSSTDGTGSSVDEGSIASYTDNPFQITTEVPPYLLFCAGVTITDFDCSSANGNYINFGTLGFDHTSYGVFTLLTGTNAQSGYNISVTGTPPTSGNNALPALVTPTFSAPGVNQFGINLRANLIPEVGQDTVGPGSGVPTSDYSQQNKYLFRSGDIIAVGYGVEDYRKFTVSYIVNVNRNQQPGVYASTYTYVCVANF